MQKVREAYFNVPGRKPSGLGISGRAGACASWESVLQLARAAAVATPGKGGARFFRVPRCAFAGLGNHGRQRQCAPDASWRQCVRLRTLRRLPPPPRSSCACRDGCDHSRDFAGARGTTSSGLCRTRTGWLAAAAWTRPSAIRHSSLSSSAVSSPVLLFR